MSSLIMSSADQIHIYMAPWYQLVHADACLQLLQRWTSTQSQIYLQVTTTHHHALKALAWNMKRNPPKHHGLIKQVFGWSPSELSMDPLADLRSCLDFVIIEHSGHPP